MHNKNKLVVKWLISLSIISLVCLCKFVFANVSAKSIIDNYDSKSEYASLYSYGNDYIMVKSKVNKTVIMKLDSDGNIIDPQLHVFDFDNIQDQAKAYRYVGSSLCDDSIYIVYNYTEYFADEFKDEILIIKYNINEKRAWSRNVEGVELSSMNDIAFGHDGQIFIVKSMLKNKIKVVNYRSINKDSKIIPTINSVNSLKVNPSKDKLYACFDNDFYCYDLTKNDYCPINCGVIPNGNYDFLDDNTIIDSKGNVYELTNGKFCYKFNTLSKHKNIVTIKDQENIISTMSSNLLYCFNKDSKLISQQNLKGNVLQFCAGKDSILILCADNNKLTIEKLSLSNVDVKKVTNNIKYRDKEKIIKDYNAAKPNNKDIDKIYVQQADTADFSTCGKVSKEVLDDALRAVNFYRRLYGLKDVKLDNDLIDIAQHSSVLALSLQNINNPVKPQGMSYDFYVRAMQSNAYDPNCMKIYDEFYPSPISKTIDYLFRTNEYFRSYILSDTVSIVGFGCSVDRDYRTCAVIATNRSTNNDKETNFISYPAAANYPSQLLNKDDKWALYLNPRKHQILKNNKPKVEIKCGAESYILDENLGVEMSVNNTCIKFPCPDFKNDSSYTIIIHNIYDLDGAAVKIEYNVNLFELQTDKISLNINPGMITSSVYNIDNKNKIITGIKPSTTVSNLKSNINYDGYTIKIINHNNKEITSGTVGTSAKVLFIKDTQTIFEYTIVIYGDLTGEGNINNADKNVLYKHLFGKKELTGYFKMAADVNHDGIINTLDLLLLNNYIEGISEIDQYPSVNEKFLK